MNKDSKIIRISDIARMAGVSTGTVDRVIHNRGRVSKKNLEKVQEVLDQVDYRPNVIAQSLASKKQYHIVALIPSFTKGQYWEIMSLGIHKAAKELEVYNIRLTQVLFDQYDPSSFDKIAEKVISSDVDGLLIATLFTEKVTQLSHQLDTLEIPYVYIDADISGNNQLAYFGTESYQCGLIAAKLLVEKLPENSNILIAQISNNNSYDSTQRKNRKKGFQDYLSEINFKGNVHQAMLKLNDENHNRKVLDKLFEENSRINGLTIFNSTCYLLGEYIKVRRLQKKILVGFDLIEKNTDLLSEGVITALIAQRPESQGYFGIKAISNYLIFKQIPEKVNLMPIDILIKENIKYYLNNKL